LTGNDDNVAPLYARHQIGVQQSKQTVPLITNATHNNDRAKIQKTHNKSNRSTIVKMKQVLEDIGPAFLLGLQELSYAFYPMFGVPILRIHEQ
jgi:hypothetical protein